MKILLLALIVVALAIPAFASGEIMQDVIDRSDVIAVVSISSGSGHPIRDIGNGCGWAYESYVISGVKNAREGQPISFRSHLVLDLSGTFLVFLSGNTIVDSQQKTFLSPNIASKLCAETGIPFTPIEYLRTDTSSAGREIILQQWTVRSEDDPMGERGENHFLVSPGLEQLFRDEGLVAEGLPPPLPLQVERATYTSKWLAYPADVLLEILANQ